MGADIKWDRLRTLSGSQQNALEELCCQLAAYEHAPLGSTFARAGAPDAGVECYWILPNGDEWGWQAKFFTSPPGKSQWSQIDKSVRDALARRPRLTRYTVCLPIDRQDPRSEDQRSFMDRWNERVERWQGWASEQGMSVEFRYWGQHEILERLSREEHRGRSLFWLDRHQFSDTWFKDRSKNPFTTPVPDIPPNSMWSYPSRSCSTPWAARRLSSTASGARSQR